jgi:hypothetical protein
MKEYLSKLIDKEGDFLEWTYTTDNGYDYCCNIRRSTGIGNLCGYVLLTPDSKLYGIDYNDIYDIVSIEIHGGLTYSGKDKEDNWVIGFDCAHLGDLIPYYLLNDMNYGIISKEVYRDMEYVKSECESLCEQISEFSLSLNRNKILNTIFL